MLLKLIIVAVIAVAVYRAFGGKVPILDKKETKQKELDADTLVECASCGTYVTLKDAIIVKKKYYCSKECLPK